MYKIKVSELAHQDLDQIVSYIAINLVSPIAATNLIDKVEECYDYLKHNPLMYAKCQNNRLGEEGYR
ncbi:hypothetical protein MASR2M70_05890 [Bacillota bacterium]